MTEQDDMENWNYASAASKGTIARRYPYNYQMAMGFENPHDVVPGLGHETTSTSKTSAACTGAGRN